MQYQSGDILFYIADPKSLWDRLLRWFLRSDVVHCSIAYVPEASNPLMFEALPKSGGIFLTPINSKPPQRTFRPPIGAWNKAVEEFNFSICNKAHYSLEDGIRARFGLRENDPNGWICSEHVRMNLILMGFVEVDAWGNTPASVFRVIPKEWEISE